METTYCQQLSAGHTTNGNPRHLWMQYDSRGNLIAVHMEGYEGTPKKLYSSIPLHSITVSVKEFNYWKKLAQNSKTILFYE